MSGTQLIVLALPSVVTFDKLYRFEHIMQGRGRQVPLSPNSSVVLYNAQIYI